MSTTHHSKANYLVRSLWEPVKQGKSKLTARRFHIALIFCVIPLKTFPDCTDTLISYSSKLYFHDIACYFVLTTFHVILIMFDVKPTVPHTCQAGLMCWSNPDSHGNLACVTGGTSSSAYITTMVTKLCSCHCFSVTIDLYVKCMSVWGW